MHNLALIIALVGILGIGAQWFAWRTGWPAIALMLVAGLIAGPVTGLVDPHRDFGHLLEPAISIAVAIILFEGGLSLRLHELKSTDGAVPRLVFLGVPIGWTLGAVALYYVAGLVWPVAILFAGILVVTGPTVVLPLLRQTNIAARPRAILKWEAIVNDPLGALCAVVTYEYLREVGMGASLFETIVQVLFAMALAGLIGFLAARFIAWTFPRGWVPGLLKSPVLLVTVIGAFVISNMIKQETGLLAVTVMGIVLANMRLASTKDFIRFKENITILLVSGVFVLLSASLDVEVLRQFEWRFVAFLLVLLFVVRPLTVLLSLAFTKIPMRERLFIAWIAPRGIVAVAISGLFALRLDDLGYSDGGLLVTLSFAVVAATILAHGFTIGPVSRLLGVRGPPSSGVLLVGANAWSLALAKHLKSLNVPVLISDRSWQSLTDFRQVGIPYYHGEVLSEATEEELDFHQFQVLAAVTGNEAYNALVCNEFAPELGRDAVYQLGDAAGDDPNKLPAELGGRALFVSGVGVEDLHDREEAGWRLVSRAIDTKADQAKVREYLPEGADPLLILKVNRKIRFFTHATRPSAEPGDIVVAYAPPLKKEVTS